MSKNTDNMPDTPVQSVRRVLAAFGAEFESTVPHLFLEWLAKTGFSYADASVIGKMIPKETVLISTKSANIGYIYCMNSIIDDSEGRTACRIRLHESGFIAMGSEYAPSLFMIHSSDPIQGPCYTINYLEFDTRETIRLSEPARLSINWFKRVRPPNHVISRHARFSRNKHLIVSLHLQFPVHGAA